MCGDVAAGLELALGDPQPEPDEPRRNDVSQWAVELGHQDITPQELADFERDEAARRARIDATVLGLMARDYTNAAYQWLKDHRDRLRSSADPVLADALDVVTHDEVLIPAKLHRALHGHDCAQHEDGVEDEPVQNDWNGSAKVALISIDRSEAAWRLIADATNDPRAIGCAEILSNLRLLTLDAFPKAVSFVRPGFDDSWR
jgi:hypothetical protein